MVVLIIVVKIIKIIILGDWKFTDCDFEYLNFDAYSYVAGNFVIKKRKKEEKIAFCITVLMGSCERDQDITSEILAKKSKMPLNIGRRLVFEIILTF